MDHSEAAGILAEYQTGERFIVRQDLKDALWFMLRLFDEQAEVVLLKKKSLDEHRKRLLEYWEAVKKWEASHQNLQSNLKFAQDSHMKCQGDLAKCLDDNATLKDGFARLENELDAAVEHFDLVNKERVQYRDRVDSLTKTLDNTTLRLEAERNAAIEATERIKKTSEARVQSDCQIIEGLRASLRESHADTDRKHALIESVFNTFSEELSR